MSCADAKRKITIQLNHDLFIMQIKTNHYCPICLGEDSSFVLTLFVGWVAVGRKASCQGLANKND